MSSNSWSPWLYWLPFERIYLVQFSCNVLVVHTDEVVQSVDVLLFLGIQLGFRHLEDVMDDLDEANQAHTELDCGQSITTVYSIPSKNWKYATLVVKLGSWVWTLASSVIFTGMLLAVTMETASSMQHACYKQIFHRKYCMASFVNLRELGVLIPLLFSPMSKYCWAKHWTPNAFDVSHECMNLI